MLHRIKHFFVLFLIITPLLWRGAGGEAFAQTYPVQITAQLQPPFSGYVPDYATPGNQNLKLLVLFTDFTKPSYNIKLKLKITGQNINIQSKGYYFAGPFTLTPGIPIEISGSDLTGLLNTNNLDFSGISIQQYNQQKVLPEGAYNICFTAYDYNNPVPIQVSNESCAFGWMVLSDPPFLNLPMCGSTTITSNPQNLIFQWTPMNLTSPNSAFNTTYDFELFEIIPGTQSAGNILQTLPPIYQITTPLTTINYGITEPVLNVGMQYVWRVRARDVTGRDLFKNNGYSQPCTFYYGSVLSQIDSSTLKLNLQGNALTHRVISYNWDSLSLFTSYKLEYRKLGGSNWFVNTETKRSSLVNNLEPENIYEARVKGIWSEGEGPWSNVVTITTPKKPEIQCGQGIASNPNSQFKPLTNGKVGQLWDIGQFEMLVTQLDNPNNPTGSYSGYGKIEIPFMLNLNLNGKFTNLLVNENMEVVQGKVEIVTDGHAGSVLNLDSLFNLFNELFNNFNETHDTTAFVTNYSNNIGSLCSVSPLSELLQDCSTNGLLNYLQNGGSNASSNLLNATNQALSNNGAQSPCDPSKVPTDLKSLVVESISCDNSFDSKMAVYAKSNLTNLISLCVEHRISMIKCLVNSYSVDDEDESTIVLLIQSTPPGQVDKLLSELKKTPSFASNGEPLWMYILDEFDEDDNIRNLVFVLSYLSEKKSSSYYTDKTVIKTIPYGSYAEYIAGGSLTEYVEMSRMFIEGDGRITIKTYNRSFRQTPPNNLADTTILSVTVDPFEDVCLVPMSAADAAKIQSDYGIEVTDNYARIPAFMWHYIASNDSRNLIKSGFYTVFAKTVSAFGLGQYSLYKGVVRYIVATADAINAVNLIMTQPGTANAIMEADPSGNFMFYWNRINLISTGTYVGAFGLKYTKALVSNYKLNKVQLQQKLPSSTFNEIDEKIVNIERELTGMGTTSISVVNSLKKLVGNSSSENILWKNLDETNVIWANPNTNVLSTAKSFANETGASLYDAVLNNGFYVKFDLNDGRILLGNTNGNYHAFAVINDNALSTFKSSVLNASDEVFNTKLSQFLSTNADKLKILSGVVSRPLTIAGRIVNLSTVKINTMLGRFKPDIANLFNELGSFKNVGLGETKGGINILNKPDYYYNPSTWWSAYNKPWLNKAIQRGDDIYLATIPTKADDIIKSGQLVGAYGEELNHLVINNYKPVNITMAEWNNIKSWLGH